MVDLGENLYGDDDDVHLLSALLWALESSIKSLATGKLNSQKLNPISDSPFCSISVLKDPLLMARPGGVPGATTSASCPSSLWSETPLVV